MKQAKRFLSMLLTLCFVLGLCPSMALAVDGMAYSVDGASSFTGFTDVKSDDWYYDAVRYAYGSGIMSGTSANAFSPDTTTTRGMVVSVLHRMEGAPSAGQADFADVSGNHYYTNAVAWASANGIVSGYTNGMFGPNDTITREQMASILYRYAKHKGYDTNVSGSLAGFADAGEINSYAAAAMGWAVGSGLISGVGQNTLAPQGNASRAQTAAILMRFQQAHAQNGAEDAQPETGNSEIEEYTVTFDLNYDKEGTYRTVTVQAGGKVQLPSSPSRSGYTFSGWYTSASGGKKYDESTPVTGDITLYASWKKDAATTGSSGGSSVGGRNNRGGTFGGYGGFGSSSGTSSSSSSGNYTVTFNSNGGSAVASQSIRPGECATQPNDPTRTGYTFVGWYTSRDLITLYNFGSAVTSDITLYARWAQEGVEVHTFLDDPDPDVEIYSFTTDTWDIQIGSTETVTFTAEVFANVALNNHDISVVDESGTVVGYMTDDDADGIYKLQLSLSSSDVKTKRYHAQYGNVSSTDVTIGYYKAYTNAELTKLDTVINDIQNAMTPYLDSNGYLAGDYDTAAHALEQKLEALKNAGEIQSYSKEAGMYTIKLPSGAEYHYAFRISGVDAAAVVISNQPYKNTYPEPLQSQSNDAADGSARKIANTFADYRFYSRTAGDELNTDTDDNYDNAEVSLDALKNLANSDVVTWHGHGGYTEEYGSFMGSGTLYTMQDVKAYEADLQAGRLLLSTDRFLITGGFVEKYVQDLTGHFLYLGACSSGKDMVDGISVSSGHQRFELAQAFLNKGASAVIANTTTISTDYNTKMERDVFSRLCEVDSNGNYYTLSAALEYARNRNGEHDQWLYDGETDYARAVIFPQNNVAASNYRLNESKAGTASGSVRDALNHQDVSNALIRIYNVEGLLLKTLRTSAAGSYSVELPAGEYVIQVTAGGYKSAKMAVAITANTTTYTETFLLLDAGITQGYVNGRVTSAVVSELGVPGVTLRLRFGWNNRNGVVLKTGTTNENGYYDFSLQSGAYTMEYAKSGYVTDYKNILVGPIDLAAQNAVIAPLTSENEYIIKLTWTDHPSDLDAHLAGPVSDGKRFHLYFPYADANGGSLYPNHFTLDLDNTQMPTIQDPETIKIVQQLNGKYVYSVHDYSNGGDASSLAMSTSNAIVTVSKGGTVIATFHVPAGIPGTIWTVFELDGDQITPINRIGNGYAEDPSFDPYGDSTQMNLMDIDMEKLKKNPENTLAEDEEADHAEADESAQETVDRDETENSESAANGENSDDSEEKTDLKDPEPSETTADDNSSGGSEEENTSEDDDTSKTMEDDSSLNNPEAEDIETVADDSEKETVNDIENLPETEN